MPVLSKCQTLQPVLDYGYVVEFAAHTEAILAESYNILDMRARDWQAVAINSLINGSDLLVRAGTGCGKSLVYLSMIAAKPNGIVLVIAPLKSLINNQVQPPALRAESRSRNLKKRIFQRLRLHMRISKTTLSFGRKLIAAIFVLSMQVLRYSSTRSRISIITQ